MKKKAVLMNSVHADPTKEAFSQRVDRDICSDRARVQCSPPPAFLLAVGLTAIMSKIVTR